MTAIQARPLGPQELDQFLADLSAILTDSVNAGAAISFLRPFSIDDGRRFWQAEVFPDVREGKRVLFVATLDRRVAGTVQMEIALPPNQPHRCAVAKMIVHPDCRNRGVGKALMQALERHALALGKTLLTLDTRTGDVAEPLYAALGFETAGRIPGFALDPDGQAFHAATYMYKQLCNVGHRA